VTSHRSHQATLDRELVFVGHGVHSGQAVKLIVKPAPVDHGIVFVRPVEGRRICLPAQASCIGATELCTHLTQGETHLATVEHLMAAISAMGLDNLEIEASGIELPILDGSAAPFMRDFMVARIVTQPEKRHYIKILKRLRVEAGEAFAEFLPPILPVSRCSSFDITIDFASAAIGRQHIAFDLNMNFFAHEIAPARTFGFMKDTQKLRALGLAQGASLDNTLIIGLDDKIINEQGTLFEDEFVRHKALDAVGDTALLGKPFIGLYRSFCGGHQLNALAVKSLLDAPNHFEIVEMAD